MFLYIYQYSQLSCTNTTIDFSSIGTKIRQKSGRKTEAPRKHTSTDRDLSPGYNVKEFFCGNPRVWPDFDLFITVSFGLPSEIVESERFARFCARFALLPPARFFDDFDNRPAFCSFSAVISLFRLDFER